MGAKCAIVGSHGMNEFLPGSVEVLVLQRRVPAPGHVIMTPVDTIGVDPCLGYHNGILGVSPHWLARRCQLLELGFRICTVYILEYDKVGH